MSNEAIVSLFEASLKRKIFKKAVFSKAEDPATVKTVVLPYAKPDGARMLQIERFSADHKAFHENLPYDDAGTVTRLAGMASDEFRQTNLFTMAGDIEIRRSRSGNCHISGKFAEESSEAALQTTDKHYLIDPSRDVAFLRDLGLSDPNGRIHDKKQAKFRQINRFLEIIRDVEDDLPKDRPAVIYDLCCGKSYLTFAVYYYFTVLRGRDVRMVGVDLKKDVIDYCNEVAQKENFKNLSFVSGNINAYDPPERPDMVISLHACDIATDIVLANAVRWQTGIILSTPCCHHEMAKQLSEPAENAPLRKEYDFILSQPMLKQKFCPTLTDALRVKRLESVGYRVTTLELIDPEETPKNLMIRAVLDHTSSKVSSEKQTAAHREYDRIVKDLAVDPYLDKLLKAQGR